MMTSRAALGADRALGDERPACGLVPERRAAKRRFLADDLHAVEDPERLGALARTRRAGRRGRTGRAAPSGVASNSTSFRRNLRSQFSSKRSASAAPQAEAALGAARLDVVEVAEPHPVLDRARLGHESVGHVAAAVGGAGARLPVGQEEKRRSRRRPRRRRRGGRGGSVPSRPAGATSTTSRRRASGIGVDREVRRHVRDAGPLVGREGSERPADRVETGGAGGEREVRSPRSPTGLSAAVPAEAAHEEERPRVLRADAARDQAARAPALRSVSPGSRFGVGHDLGFPFRVVSSRGERLGESLAEIVPVPGREGHAERRRVPAELGA